MAQVQNLGRNLDPYCDYHMFKSRIGGQIACLAIGNGTVQNFAENKGEITGISFQKVDEGIVQAVFDSNNFSQVNWENAPTRNRQRDYFQLDEPAFAPTKKWHDFCNLMLHLRGALMRQMSPPNGHPPGSLYEGLHSDIWIGGISNSRQSTSELSQIRDIKQIIGRHWVDDEVFLELMDTLMKGFFDGAEQIGNLLGNLLNIFKYTENFKRKIKQAPAETSKNKSLQDGVVHCLVYGYNPEQLELARAGQFQDRGRLRHRVLLHKALGNRSRSRSRSPSPVSELQYQVENRRPNQQNQPITIQNMLHNPDDYVLMSNSLHFYFEPHKPDFLIYSHSINDGVTGKILIEVSSYVKYGRQTSFDSHLNQSTEQCVQQCLAALSHNQTEISGLVIVPDGMKIIKIQRQDNPNVIYYVKETNLVTWNQTGQLYALLNYLEKAME